MKNYLQLEINGQKYGLKFNIGTFKIMKEQMDIEPFKHKAATDQLGDIIAWVKPIFHAALLSNHKSKGESVEYTEQQIDSLVNELSVTDIGIIDKMWSSPADSKPSVNGEVATNTQGADLGGVS